MDNLTVSPQAQKLREKTARLREESGALHQYWLEVIGDVGKGMDKRIKLWLHEYPAADIEESITRLAKWIVDHADEGLNVTRVLKVFKGILRIVHAGGLSEDAKAAELSRIRAEAGRVGAAARWQRERKQALLQLSEQLDAAHADGKTDGKTESDAVCHDLPSDAKNLADFVTRSPQVKVNGYGLGVKRLEVSSPTVTVNGNGCRTASPSARKANSKPKTNSKTKTCRQCGEPLGRDNHTCPVPVNATPQESAAPPKDRFCEECWGNPCECAKWKAAGEK